MEEIIITAAPEDVGQRLDKLLSEKLGVTRSHIQHAIERGEVLLSGRPAQAKDKPKAGQEISVMLAEPTEIAVEPEDIPIDIVYQDADLAVINKARGMVVHPAVGNESGTLVNAILYHIKDLSGINGEIRPGIVHRLDKDTTGLIVIAKNDAAHVSLAEQIKEKSAHRSYQVLVHGNLKEESVRVEAPIGRHRTDRKRMAIIPDGRYAATNFTVLERFKGYVLLRADLETGRTHQIRVHSAHIGHCVVGDPVYGSRVKDPFKTEGQLLHAFRLALDHPRTGERMVFTAPLPDDFEAVLEKLRKIQ